MQALDEEVLLLLGIEDGSSVLVQFIYFWLDSLPPSDSNVNAEHGG